MDDQLFNKPDYNAPRLVRRDSRPSVTEICAELLIGEYPRPQDAAWLRQDHRVTAVHSLQDDLDLRINGLDELVLAEAYAAAGIRFARTPISDAGSDCMAQRLDTALQCLVRLVADGERVYLHCNAGLNRAPTLAIGFLHVQAGLTLREAMDHVKSRRVCGPYMSVLENYFDGSKS